MHTSPHHFHIPVMGLAFTVDTPLKVARFGISSVVSIIEDHLLEQMREFHSKREGLLYERIETTEKDHRALRITAYLNLLQEITTKQFTALKEEEFRPGTSLTRYFELLPERSTLKAKYLPMLNESNETEKRKIQLQLKMEMVCGEIDVNIMTKVDRMPLSSNGELPEPENSDAMSALRGFALSNLNSSIVFSAGLNPKLFTYCATFPDFSPDEKGIFRKKIILKVSDYRSALIQGKFLASKGLWISEFRIESGLNCGGHAFPTDGNLLGPVLEEFRTKKEELHQTLSELYLNVLQQRVALRLTKMPLFRITVQGGIGTSQESRFLMEHYQLEGTGWGSPFLLVPEATNVDASTLDKLTKAIPEDYYLSHASPLGIPFNNFRRSSSEEQRKQRILKGRPGSPCYKKFLSFNTEFTTEPICTASREYQHLKLEQLKATEPGKTEYEKQFSEITEKDCLCEGLGASVILKNKLKPSHRLTAVSICPGPNLAYFSKVFSLDSMIDHIYGRKNLLNHLKRKHMFINELDLYIQYLKKETEACITVFQKKKATYLNEFKENLKKSIAYYQELSPALKRETEQSIVDFRDALLYYSTILQEINIPSIG